MRKRKGTKKSEETRYTFQKSESAIIKPATRGAKMRAMFVVVRNVPRILPVVFSSVVELSRKISSV